VKKARGKSKAEVKKMEHELRAKQQAELHALDRELAALRPKRVPKPPSPKVNDSDGSDDGETGSSDDDDAPSPGEKGPTPDVRLVVACARASRVFPAVCRVSCTCAILPLSFVGVVLIARDVQSGEQQKGPKKPSRAARRKVPPRPLPVLRSRHTRLLTPARKRNEKWNVCFVLF
jgi:hypothetical protein